MVLKPLYGYLYGVHWSNLSQEEYDYLLDGYSFDENVELIIASQENLDIIETFYKIYVENFAFIYNKMIVPCYTLLKITEDDYKVYLKNDINNTINKILLAFRLYKRGLILNNIIFLQDDSALLEYKSEKAKTDYLISSEFPFGEPYIISYEELDAIRNIYQSIRNIPISEDIKIVVKKLDSCYSDLSKDKKLLEIITALEILFKENKPKEYVRDHIINEIRNTYKKSNLKVKGIEKYIHKAYDFRNKIIHEGYSNNIDDMVLTHLMSYLRNSLLYALSKK